MKLLITHKYSPELFFIEKDGIDLTECIRHIEITQITEYDYFHDGFKKGQEENTYKSILNFLLSATITKTPYSKHNGFTLGRTGGSGKGVKGNLIEY